VRVLDAFEVNEHVDELVQRKYRSMDSEDHL
jgi:hypothetical protein